MYRKDRLQTWSVISTAHLCTSPKGQDAAFELVGNTLYIITDRTVKTAIDSNYWSCLNWLGGNQSVALYRPGSGGTILRIMPSGGSSVGPSLAKEWNDGFVAYVRYTYVYKPGDIVITGAVNEYINNILVYVFIGLSYLSIFFFKSGVPATVFLTLYFLIAGLVQAIFNLSNTILYIGVTIAIILLSAFVAGMVFKMPRVHVPVCIACFVVFTLWLGLGIPFGTGMFISLFPYLIYAILIIAGLFGCLKSTDRQPLRSQMVSLSTLFGLTTYLPFYLVYIYLPIPYLTIYHWRKGYLNDSNAVGIYLFFWLGIALAVNIVLTIGIFCFWKRKPSSYYETRPLLQGTNGYNNPTEGAQEGAQEGVQYM